VKFFCDSCNTIASWEVVNDVTRAQYRRLFSCSKCLGNLVSHNMQNTVLPLADVIEFPLNTRTVAPVTALSVVAAAAHLAA
jgi:hypothetical protein